MEKQQKNIIPPPQNVPYYGTENDPSPLTTQLVLREIASLKELLQQRVEGVEKGIDVAHDDLTRLPTEVQRSVSSAQALVDNKIFYENQITSLKVASINNHVCFLEKQLAWMEVMRVEQKKDIKDAANKSEEAATKQVDQLAELLNRGLGNLNDKIGDLKNGFTVSDSTSKGKTLGIAQVISVVVAVATIVGIAVGMVMKYLAATGK